MNTDQIVEQIIEWSKDNTAGTVLNKYAIWQVVIICDEMTPLETLEMLVARQETPEGYMVKARDFVSAFEWPAERIKILQGNASFHIQKGNKLLADAMKKFADYNDCIAEINELKKGSKKSWLQKFRGAMKRST